MKIQDGEFLCDIAAQYVPCSLRGAVVGVELVLGRRDNVFPVMTNRGGLKSALRLGIVLDQDFVDDPAVDVGQAEVAAGVAVGESFVVDAQLVQDGRLEVVDADERKSPNDKKQITNKFQSTNRKQLTLVDDRAKDLP